MSVDVLQDLHINLLDQVNQVGNTWGSCMSSDKFTITEVEKVRYQE